MSPSPSSMILDAYRKNHQHILAFAEQIPETQLTWQPAPEALSMAFFLWHLGRWADHLQAAIPGMTPELSRRLPPGQQIWVAEGLDQAWGFDAQRMGYAETGMTMDEDAAASLRFPPKEILLDYVRKAFAAADRAIAAVDDAQFMALEDPQALTEGIWSPGGTVGGAIFSHLLHDSRHLGMMECLLGQQVSSGSATI